MIVGIAVCVGLFGALLGAFAWSAAMPTYGVRHVHLHHGMLPRAVGAGSTALAAACSSGPPAFLLAACAAGLGAATVYRTLLLVRTGDAANREHTSRLHVRMWDIRSQVHRLQNKDHIEARLNRQAEVHGILDRYGQRFESILVAIEHHLLLGDPERAERIITLFARHLRNLLFEGSVPFLAVKTSVEHIRVHLRLMGELTDHRVEVEVEEVLPSRLDRDRYTESLQLTPWAEAVTWPLFEQAERTTTALPGATLALTLVGRTLQATCTVEGIHVSAPLEVRMLGEGQAAGPWTAVAQEATSLRAATTARMSSAAVA